MAKGELRPLPAVVVQFVRDQVDLTVRMDLLQPGPSHFSGNGLRWMVSQHHDQPVHLGPPVTVALSRGGYLLVTEANLVRYSGMTLRPVGERRLQAVFEDDPVGFNIEGTIVSPWRVAVVANDLNESDRLLTLRNSTWLSPTDSLGNAGARNDWQY